MIQELNQSYLEEQILNQLNVVFEGQIFPAWIRRQTVVHLKIGNPPYLFIYHSARTLTSGWSIVSTAPAPRVRLSRGSEIVIAPKPRHSNNTGTRSNAISSENIIFTKLAGSETTVFSPAKTATRKVKPKRLRVQPSSFIDDVYDEGERSHSSDEEESYQGHLKFEPHIALLHPHDIKAFGYNHQQFC